MEREGSVLTELAAEYRKWSAEAIAAIRFANDLDSMDDRAVDRAWCLAFEARTKRDEAARKYIEESERLRSKKCGHPIEVNIVACAECCRVNEYTPPTTRQVMATREGRRVEMSARVIPIGKRDRNLVTKDALLASWRAVERQADTEGFVRMNEAGVAGQLLAYCDGDAALAMTMVPTTRGAFWARVVSYLERATREVAAR